MKKILTSIRNGSAIHALACSITPEAKVIATGVAYLTPIITGIETGIAGFEHWSGTTVKDPNVQKMEDLDKIQDNAFVWVRDFTGALTHSPDAAIAAHALTVWLVFERHGLSIHTKGYSDEYSDFRSLLNELNGAPLQAAVNATGLRPWIDRLSTTTAAFNTVYVQRATGSKTTDATKSRAAQASMIKYMNMLLANLDLVEETTKDAGILARLKTINGLVDQFNTKLRADRSRGKSDDSDEVDTKA